MTNKSITNKWNNFKLNLISKLSLLMCLSLLCFSKYTHAAGFDCNHANTWVEKSICSNSKLSKLDEKMTLQFKETMKDLDKQSQSEVRLEQKNWLKYQRNTCLSLDCLTREYEERLSGKYNYGTAWDYATDLTKAELPTSLAFGEYKEEVINHVYNSDMPDGYEAIESTNTLMVHQIPSKPYLAIIEGLFVFHNAHVCNLEDEKANWSQNHWLINHYEGDTSCELRLYPNQKNNKILLRDVDNQCRMLYCGMNGYFEGVKMSK